MEAVERLEVLDREGFAQSYENAVILAERLLNDSDRDVLSVPTERTSSPFKSNTTVVIRKLYCHAFLVLLPSKVLVTCDTFRGVCRASCSVVAVLTRWSLEARLISRTSSKVEMFSCEWTGSP
eukprot:41362-Rhodomonas_salina.2